MNQNHALLMQHEVASEGLEEAVFAALDAGAYGAKMTGAGGEGGAALALCKKEEMGRLAGKVREKTGFASYPLTLAKRGAAVD
jgi:mevalonate kinase